MHTPHAAALLLLTLVTGCAALSPAAAGRSGHVNAEKLAPLATDPALLSVDRGGTLGMAVPPSGTVAPAAAANAITPVPAPAVGITPVSTADRAMPIAQAAPDTVETPAAAATRAVAKVPAAKAAPAVAAVLPAATQHKSEPAPPPVAAPPALDIAALKARLRDTKAIGVFSKLALKNQMDDMLGQFRSAYKTGQKTAPAALRQPYEMLVLKVLALLQEGDPALARSVAGSREALWGILANADSFQALA